MVCGPGVELYSLDKKISILYPKSDFSGFILNHFV